MSGAATVVTVDSRFGDLVGDCSGLTRSGDRVGDFMSTSLGSVFVAIAGGALPWRGALLDAEAGGNEEGIAEFADGNAEFADARPTIRVPAEDTGADNGGKGILVVSTEVATTILRRLLLG